METQQTEIDKFLASTDILESQKVVGDSYDAVAELFDRYLTTQESYEELRKHLDCSGGDTLMQKCLAFFRDYKGNTRIQIFSNFTTVFQLKTTKKFLIWLDW